MTILAHKQAQTTIILAGTGLPIQLVCINSFASSRLACKCPCEQPFSRPNHSPWILDLKLQLDLEFGVVASVLSAAVQHSRKQIKPYEVTECFGFQQASRSDHAKT